MCCRARWFFGATAQMAGTSFKMGQGLELAEAGEAGAEAEVRLMDDILCQICVSFVSRDFSCAGTQSSA